MSKTLLMTTLALAALATAAIPTASACTFFGPAGEQLTYAVCYVPGPTWKFARGEAGDAQDFANQEAADTVAFAQELASHAPLP